MRYPLALPDITDREIQAVVDVLKTPNLALGPKLAEFEAEFTRRCRTRHAVAVSSGTAGLHLLIRAAGIGEGDEVITTPFSFVASANCILYERARPVFVDVDPETWNIDAGAIEAAVTPRTRAILPVDVFGQPGDYEAISGIANRHGLRVIEDSCEALGSRYRARPAGSLGDAGAFGFYPNKQITTGEGGMIVTDDDALADACRSMRNQGRDTMGGWLEHTRLGFNYRISDINCALGLAQLQRLDEIMARRSERAAWYREILGEEPRVVLQRVRPDVEVSWFVFVVRLSDDYSSADRDRLLSGLRDRGIGCSNYFVPIHLQAYMVEAFGFRRGELPRCEALTDRTIALPFHTELTRDDIAEVCRELRGLL
jgi:perosamine synthetase